MIKLNKNNIKYVLINILINNYGKKLIKAYIASLSVKKL